VPVVIVGFILFNAIDVYPAKELSERFEHLGTPVCVDGGSELKSGVDGFAFRSCSQGSLGSGQLFFVDVDDRTRHVSMLVG
jgi:hypothetical protein